MQRKREKIVSIIHMLVIQVSKQTPGQLNFRSKTNSRTLRLEHWAILSYGFILKCSQTLTR